MPNLYRNESSDPRFNAQRNLSGRTHYVDSDTLRFHKARVLSARSVCNGLLFAIVESVALDPNNAKRGVRYVIFDLFGNVVGERKTLEDCFSRSAQAEKAMWAEINRLSAIDCTLGAIKRAEHHHAQEMEQLRATLKTLAAENKAA